MNEFRPRPGEVDDILRRGDQMRRQHAFLTAIGAVLVASTVILAPNTIYRGGLSPTNSEPTPSASPSSTPTESPSGSATPDAATTAWPGGTTATPATGPGASPGPALRCAAGANGGTTDDGVTGEYVRLFTTVSMTGATPTRGDWLLRWQHTDVNQTGGICGRRLDLRTKDDRSTSSASELEDAIESGTFALPYIGDPDALDSVIRRGYLKKYSTAVVGVPTRDPRFYDTQWVWPAGVSDAAAARIMVRDAYRRGARTFGVVYDDVLVGAAFDAEVVRLTGKRAKHQDASKCTTSVCPDANVDAHNFYADPPDFVGLLVHEAYALDWMTSINTPGADDARVPQGYGTTDHLMAERFRSDCAAKCNGLRAWSAYKASCGAYESDPAVQRYETAIERTPEEDDPRGRAVYAGFEMLVAALREAGPDLTRERLRHVLDTATLRVPMTVAETFTRSNDVMREYVLSTRGGFMDCSLGSVGRYPAP